MFKLQIVQIVQKMWKVSFSDLNIQYQQTTSNCLNEILIQS